MNKPTNKIVAGMREAVEHAKNPFIADVTAYGRTEQIVDVDLFARHLAEALVIGGVTAEAVPIETDAMPKWRSQINVNDDDTGKLKLIVSTDNASPRHNGRVVISAYVADVSDRDYPHTNEYKMPSATFSTERPMKALTDDVVRRVIDGSIGPAGRTRRHAQANHIRRGQLDDAVTALETRFPELLNVKKTDDGMGATVQVDSRSSPSDYFYLWGRLDNAGRFTLDRVQTMNPEFFADLCALVRRHYPVKGQPKPTTGVDHMVDMLRSYVSGDDGDLDKLTFLSHVADRIKDDLEAVEE